MRKVSLSGTRERYLGEGDFRWSKGRTFGGGASDMACITLSGYILLKQFKFMKMKKLRRLKFLIGVRVLVSDMIVSISGSFKSNNEGRIFRGVLR